MSLQKRGIPIDPFVTPGDRLEKPPLVTRNGIHGTRLLRVLGKGQGRGNILFAYLF